MKKHLPSFLPALALLTLGGCATTSNLATTENDGMYYSSADKVTAVPMAPQAPLGDPGAVANPDYSGNTARNGTDEYYDDEDDYYAASRQRRFRSPYRGSSLGYYDFSYSDPYFYGAPIIGYSPYGYSPYSFYDPFYRPYYGYGGLIINIGYGFGRSFYHPYSYGYGYDPYGFGGFGRSWGNYYGGGYRGNGGYYGNNGYYGVGSDRSDRNVTYGPRRSRTSNGAGLADAPSGSGSMASPGRSRVVQEGRFATPGNASANTPADRYNGRGRVRDVTVGNGNSSASGQPASATESGSRTGRYRDSQPMNDAAKDGQPAADTRRWRVLDNSAPNNGSPASNGRMTERPAADQPQSSGRGRRATYYSGDNGSNDSNQRSEQRSDQPQRQRTTQRSSTPTRAYSEPTRSNSEPTRSYSEPSQPSQPSRSYSEPSRSSSPASPSPSNSGSSGNDGGGRGRVR